MSIIDRIMNRKPATVRLEKWTRRANRPTDECASGEVLELNLKDEHPVVRRVGTGPSGLVD